ncbi:hypothetical protein, partial [Paenibacillus timonensis]|uniref:hypothetical protein n=1 Tax=Paenibacillus timonensis TaxID=225915 RepID=UPI0022E87B33
RDLKSQFITHSLFSFQRSNDVFRYRFVSAATFIIYHAAHSLVKTFFIVTIWKALSGLSRRRSDL